jgi:hypothetical protein
MFLPPPFVVFPKRYKTQRSQAQRELDSKKAELRPAVKQLLKAEGEQRARTIESIREGPKATQSLVLDLLLEFVVGSSDTNREKARLVLAEFRRDACVAIMFRLTRTQLVTTTVRLVETFPWLFSYLDDLALADLHNCLGMIAVKKDHPEVTEACRESRRLLEEHISRYHRKNVLQIMVEASVAGHLAHQRAAQAKPVWPQAAVVDVQ